MFRTRANDRRCPTPYFLLRHNERNQVGALRALRPLGLLFPTWLPGQCHRNAGDVVRHMPKRQFSDCPTIGAARSLEPQLPGG